MEQENEKVVSVPIHLIMRAHFMPFLSLQIAHIGI